MEAQRSEQTKAKIKASMAETHARRATQVCRLALVSDIDARILDLVSSLLVSSIGIFDLNVGLLVSNSNIDYFS